MFSNITLVVSSKSLEEEITQMPLTCNYRKICFSYRGFSLSPPASPWLIASCHPFSSTPPPLRDSWRCHSRDKRAGKKQTALENKTFFWKETRLLCLAAWLLMFDDICDGEAYPLTCGFFSVFIRSLIILRRERTHAALTQRRHSRDLQCPLMTSRGRPFCGTAVRYKCQPASCQGKNWCNIWHRSLI